MPLCQGFSTVGRRKRMAQETLRMQGEENISKYTAHLLSRHHYLKREKWEELLTECSGYVNGMETKEWETLSRTKKQTHGNTRLATSCAKPLQSCQAPLSMGFCSKNAGVGGHALLQGIFLSRGSIPHPSCLLHWPAGSSSPVPPGKPSCVAPVLKTLPDYIPKRNENKNVPTDFTTALFIIAKK